MNGMCVSPTAGRCNTGGSEKVDAGDSIGGSSDAIGAGDSGTPGESGGSGGGNHGGRQVMRSGSAGESGTEAGNDDGSISSLLFRKAVMEPTRHARNQGIRKLQKCLSTSVSHYDEGSGSGSFAASFPLHTQRSVDIRNYTTTSSQASLTSPNILTTTRQYSSFGSTNHPTYLESLVDTMHLHYYCGFSS